MAYIMYMKNYSSFIEYLIGLQILIKLYAAYHLFNRIVKSERNFLR